MGFFRKKKNSDSSSILSEAEIQKKLYGEFSDGTSHVVVGDREPSKESSAVLPKEPLPEKDPSFDLFSAQREALAEERSFPRKASPEPKPVETTSRHDPVRSFEKRSAFSPATPKPPASSVSSNSHARFTYARGNGWNVFFDLWSGFSEKIGELFNTISDPKQVAIRRVLYWGAAVLVVFLLFWGVNALNSQREEAMQTRYKISGEKALVRESVQETAVVPASPITKPVVERPVVITPAPVRPEKRHDSDQTVSASASGPYVIQVVTYPTRQDADQIVNVFERVGLRAFVKEDARASGRVFYLVLIGGFRTAAEAQAELSKFRTKEVARPFQDAFVKTNRS